MTNLYGMTGGEGHLDPWAIPSAGLQLYKHRNEIASIWSRLATTLRGEKSIVAVTGMPGVGKTVLMDHLTGAGLKDNYRPPGTSRKLEEGRRRAHRARLRFRVVPGQASPVRLQSMDQLFNAKKPIAGLIHVTANGFHSVRRDFSRSQLEQDLSLDQYLANQREAEVNDLRATLDYARGAMRRHKGPFWIVVAVNKADLFASADDLTAARDRYTDPDGAFAGVLQDFASQVGTDNVQWECRPVSVWPELFSWAGESVASHLDRSQQLQMLLGLARVVDEHSGAKRV